MNTVVNIPIEKMPTGNMIFDGLSKKFLKEIKFWIRIEAFDKKLAAIQAQAFAEEFDREMCGVIHRRIR